MLTEIEGNLFELQDEGRITWILQGCNCFKTMGAGLAAQVRTKRPDAVKADNDYPKRPHERGGTYSWSAKDMVINAYTQYRPGRNFNYQYFAEVLQKINVDFKKETIGIPQIGAGIAGGNWNVIKKMIEEFLTDVDAVIVYLPQYQPKNVVNKT